MPSIVSMPWLHLSRCGEVMADVDDLEEDQPREGIEPPGNGSAVRRINHSANSARGRGRRALLKALGTAPSDRAKSARRAKAHGSYCEAQPAHSGERAPGAVAPTLAHLLEDVLDGCD